MMSDKNHNASKVKGCLGCGCLVWIILVLIVISIYIFSDNSVDSVESITYKEIIYHLFEPDPMWGSNDNYKKNRHPLLVKMAEEKGILVDKNLKNVLEAHKCISDIEFKDIGKLSSDANIVQASFSINPTDVFPKKLYVRMNFMVTPKNFTEKSFTKNHGLYEVVMTGGALTVKLSSQNELVRFSSSLFSEKKFSDIYRIYAEKINIP